MKLSRKIVYDNCECSTIKSKYVYIDYNRQLNMFFFSPCCGALPKKFIKPIAFTYDEIMNNFEQCIKIYMEADLCDLNKYYEGRCEYYRESCQVKTNLCTNYTANKNIETMQVMISHWCNLKCSMCCVREEYDEVLAKIYKKILQEVSKLNFIKKMLTTGKGEPFFYKKEIFDILKNTNKSLIVVSNGTLITDKDIDFLEQYNDRLKIVLSIDSTVKSVYEKIRIGANYEHVMHVLDELKKRNMLYCVNYVYQELNKDVAYADLLWFKKNDIRVKILIDFTMFEKKDCVDVDIDSNVKKIIKFDKGYLL